jgi:2-phosphoglycerate kinase
MPLSGSILIGGSSSTGKTTAARWLASRLNLPVVHLDEYLAEIPDAGLAFPASQPGFWEQPADQICKLLIALAERASVHIQALLEKQTREGQPMLIEGERLHPALLQAAAQAGQAAGILVIEDDPEQLHATLLGRSQRFRDLPARQQQVVVQADSLYGGWLREQAVRRGLAWTCAQPWETLGARIALHIELFRAL